MTCGHGGEELRRGWRAASRLTKQRSNRKADGTHTHARHRGGTATTRRWGRCQRGCDVGNGTFPRQRARLHTAGGHAKLQGRAARTRERRPAVGGTRCWHARTHARTRMPAGRPRWGGGAGMQHARMHTCAQQVRNQLHKQAPNLERVQNIDRGRADMQNRGSGGGGGGDGGRRMLTDQPVGPREPSRRDQ